MYFALFISFAHLIIGIRIKSRIKIYNMICGRDCNDSNFLDTIWKQMSALIIPRFIAQVSLLRVCGRIVLRWVTETSQPFYIIQIPSLNLCQVLHCVH